MFSSQYACLIWDKLYTVLVPDQLTMSPEYIKRFGVHVTGNREFDNIASSNLTTVMIPIAKILEYYEDGIEIQIPQRVDMVQMHKDIELYLKEWEEHIKYDINLSLSDHKNFILSLEKLSKYIYNKARNNELFENLFLSKKIGIMNPLQTAEETKKETVKPDYQGIGQLIRDKSKTRGRF